MLRSSEIKPLFVDLSHCWQVIFFFLSIVPSGCVCEWTTNFFYHLSLCGVRIRVLVWLRMRTRSMSAYSNECCPLCVRIWVNGCVCVPVQWSRMQPYLSRFLWTFLVMSAYSNECCPLYVRIWVNGCVYGWRVGAYMDDVWVRIWMTCGCVWNHTSVVSYDPFLWWVRIRMNVVPHASAYESMGAYMDDLWVRIG